MIEPIKSYFQGKDIEVVILSLCLYMILILLAILVPTFERGPEMAIFLASLAIVIVSVLGYKFSDDRTKLLEDQNDIIESQSQQLEILDCKIEKQTEIVQELSTDMKDIINEDQSNNVGERNEKEEPTEE